jgi:LysR family hydrogen peroxide-inducible transcriptional activator
VRRCFARGGASISQPSLSQQIQKLEAELNQQLFDRLPRSVVLTEAGRTLLEYARKILTELADAGRAVAALEHEVGGRLAVGAIPSIALYVLPRLIVSFQRSYPKVTFELFEDTTDKLAQRLEDGVLDVVLASSGDETPTLVQHSLGKEPLLMLLPEKHRLARKKRSNGASWPRRSFSSCTNCIRSRSPFGGCSLRTI